MAETTRRALGIRWKNRVGRWPFTAGVAALTAVAGGIRFPILRTEPYPYLFCDESIWSAETARLINSGEWVTKEFRSGQINTLVPLLVLRILSRLGIAISSHEHIVTVGRLSLVVLGNMAVVPVLFLIMRALGATPRAALFGPAVFVASPYALGTSTYWYPDSYMPLVSGLVLLTQILFLTHPTRSRAIASSVALGVSLSVKHTSVLLVAPLLLAALIPSVRRRIFGSGGWRPLLAFGMLHGLIVGLVFLTLNFSVLFNPLGFVEGALFNAGNYNRVPGSLQGLLFLVSVAGVQFFGPFGLIPLACGIRHRASQRCLGTSVVLMAPVVLTLAIFGLSGLVLHRNLSLVVPHLVTLSAIGLVSMQRVVRRVTHRHSRAIERLLLGVIVAPNLIWVAASISQMLGPDTRADAEFFIAGNIPASVTVGTNQSCSGPSPAAVAGRDTVRDPFIEKSLDYYVFDTYWASSVTGYYQEYGLLTPVHQRYMHYYYPFVRPKPYFAISEFPPSLASISIDERYRLVARFSGNGPDVFVLQRRTVDLSNRPRSEWPDVFDRLFEPPS